MFDNTFSHWKDSQFGKVTSIRCIIKAAAMTRYGIPKATPIADIRARLAKENAVQPPEWFQAMLTQGVLLMNAALTASADAARSDADAIARHTAFWRPVVERIVEEILAAKQGAAPEDRGVVFAWWGAHARSLRATVERMQKKYPGVTVEHIDHPNPAAQGDIFCDNDHFGTVNKALKSLGMGPIDWLPSVGWDKGAKAQVETADRMGDFIVKTMELHKFYLDRLQGVGDEKMDDLPSIAGVMATALMAFPEAVTPVGQLMADLKNVFLSSHNYARAQVTKGASGRLTEHEVAAIHLYTQGSRFYRELNAALRHPDRARALPYFAYLRLFFEGISKLERRDDSLYRGVRADIRAQYPKGTTVTWWGVSSCTPKLSVAQGFLGASGKRVLFEVKPVSAVSIKTFSAFTGEEEYILAPGTQLKVVDVRSQPNGLSTVKLAEVPDARMVA